MHACNHLLLITLRVCVRVHRRRSPSVTASPTRPRHPQRPRPHRAHAHCHASHVHRARRRAPAIAPRTYRTRRVTRDINETVLFGATFQYYDHPVIDRVIHVITPIQRMGHVCGAEEEGCLCYPRNKNVVRYRLRVCVCERVPFLCVCVFLACSGGDLRLVQSERERGVRALCVCVWRCARGAVMLHAGAAASE